MLNFNDQFCKVQELQKTTEALSETLCCVLSLLSNTDNSKILERSLIPGAKGMLPITSTTTQACAHAKPEFNQNTFCHWKNINNVTMTLLTLRFYHSFRNYFFKDQIEKWANIGYNVDYSVETQILKLPFVLFNQQSNVLSFELFMQGFCIVWIAERW